MPFETVETFTKATRSKEETDLALPNPITRKRVAA